MSEALKQPVVDETQGSATPEPTVDGARNDGNDLDSLLSQFEQESAPRTPPVSPQTPTQQQQPPDRPQIDPSVKMLVDRFEKEDLQKLVKTVQGDNPEFDDIVAEAFIDAMARRDTRLQRAWLERVANPKAFEQISKQLAKEFAKRTARKTDPQATEDREAVAAAVRGSSTNRTPESAPPDFSRMGSAEYRNAVREKYGFDPGV